MADVSGEGWEMPKGKRSDWSNTKAEVGGLFPKEPEKQAPMEDRIEDLDTYIDRKDPMSEGFFRVRDFVRANRAGTPNDDELLEKANRFVAGYRHAVPGADADYLAGMRAFLDAFRSRVLNR
jgi:hypothetical protein